MNEIRLEITEKEIVTAKAVARKAASKWPLVESEDLQSELILWLYENAAMVQRFQEDEEGPIKLLIALRRRANQICVREQVQRSGTQLDHYSKYSIDQIEKSLLALFNSPSTSGTRVNPETGEMLGEVEDYVENKRTLMIDVRKSFLALDVDAQRLVVLKYAKEYTYRDMGVLEGMSAPGIRKRIRKSLRQIQQRLNGE